MRRIFTDPAEIAQHIADQTSQTKAHLQDYVHTAKKLQQDPQREIRHTEHYCRFHYYLSHISGQGFTQYQCEFCSQFFYHPNTHTPRVCEACAGKYDICRQCAGTIDL